MDDKKKVVVLAAVIGICAMVVSLPFLPHTELPVARGKAQNIPASGIANNDTGGKVPGDPQNGINGLKTIYRLSTQYKNQLDDACRATGNRSRMQDMMQHPEKYGFKDRDDFMTQLGNPDTKYGDTASSMKAGVIPYVFPCSRPDGSVIGSTKKPQERDVIAYTSLYMHMNTRHFSHEKMTYNPVGFYLVLWDDGQVEKIPYHDALDTEIGKTNSRTTAFQGQAGLTAPRTYDEQWRAMGMSRGPRGKEGSKGESPDDLPLTKN